MFVKKNYSFWMTFKWSKNSFLFGILYAGLICFIAYYFELSLSLPWQPIGVIGIAVAFYLGFKTIVLTTEPGRLERFMVEL